MTDAGRHGDASGGARGATVAVIGGGIAGLSAAWTLTSAAPDTHVVVLESDDRLGGKILTGTFGGRAVELGPDAFLARRPEAVDLCRELGLGDDLVSPGSRIAYVWARGKLRPLPAGLALGVPTRWGPLARSGIVSPWGMARPTLDALGWPSSRGAEGRGPRDRPVAAITRRRLGREVTESLVDPLIGGIHAGDTTQMSAAAVFPALLAAEGSRGSLMRALRSATPAPTPTIGHPPGPDGQPPVFHTVRGGLSRMVDALARALGDRGVEVRLETRVDRLELRRVDGNESGRPERGETSWALHTKQGTVVADAVVIATPASTAAALLRSVDSTVAAMVGEIDYADVTLVTLRFPEESVGRPLEGTGFLVPATSGCVTTACTWLTSKWPDLQRPGDVLLRASTGRFGDDRPAHLADDAIVDRVLDELGPMLGLRSPPTEATVTRWAQAFPQYAVGHPQRVSALEQSVARLPAVALAGAAYHGVGIPACIASGRDAAAAVMGHPAVAPPVTR